MGFGSKNAPKTDAPYPPKLRQNSAKLQRNRDSVDFEQRGKHGEWVSPRYARACSYCSLAFTVNFAEGTITAENPPPKQHDKALYDFGWLDERVGKVVAAWARSALRKRKHSDT